MWLWTPHWHKTLPAIAQREAQGGAEPFLLPVQLMETHREKSLRYSKAPLSLSAGQGAKATCRLSLGSNHGLHTGSVPHGKRDLLAHAPASGRGRAMLE